MTRGAGGVKPEPLISGYTEKQRYSNTETQGYRDTEIDTEIQGYRDRYRDTEIQGYRDTRIQRNRNTELQGYRNTEMQRYRNTDLQLYRNQMQIYMYKCRDTRYTDRQKLDYTDTWIIEYLTWRYTIHDTRTQRNQDTEIHGSGYTETLGYRDP